MTRGKENDKGEENDREKKNDKRGGGMDSRWISAFAGTRFIPYLIRGKDDIEIETIKKKVFL